MDEQTRCDIYNGTTKPGDVVTAWPALNAGDGVKVLVLDPAAIKHGVACVRVRYTEGAFAGRDDTLPIGRVSVSRGDEVSNQ